MLLSRFRTQVLYSLLGSKLAVILTIFFHLLQSKFIFEQVRELLFIVVPLFAVYLVAASSYLSHSGTELQRDQNDKSVSGPILFLGRWVPILFAIYMIIVLTAPSSGTAEKSTGFQQMKEMVGWAEVIFGFFLGYVFTSLFQWGNTSPSQTEALSATLEKIQQMLAHPSRATTVQSIDAKQLKALIVSGQISAAIESLVGELESKEDSGELLNQVLNLHAQFHLYTQQRRVNLVGDDTILNRVRQGLLEIIDQVDGK